MFAEGRIIHSTYKNRRLAVSSVSNFYCYFLVWIYSQHFQLFIFHFVEREDLLLRISLWQLFYLVALDLEDEWIFSTHEDVGFFQLFRTVKYTIFFLVCLQNYKDLFSLAESLLEILKIFGRAQLLVTGNQLEHAPLVTSWFSYFIEQTFLLSLAQSHRAKLEFITSFDFDLGWRLEVLEGGEVSEDFVFLGWIGDEADDCFAEGVEKGKEDLSHEFGTPL